MSGPGYKPIETVPEFLLHALELERDSAECYRQLGETMAIHHNPEVADLFRHMADMSEAHASQIVARAEGLMLPEIAPWDFKWGCPGGPESHTFDTGQVSYLMTPLEALQLALQHEIRGRDFYAHVASSAPVMPVRTLAGEMAEEEDAHVDILKDWIAREGRATATRREDLDPPNMPE